jgi:hypothetical protein
MLACKVALAIAVVVGIASLAGSAGAEPAKAKSDASVDAAQELFDRGRALVKEGRSREACPLFEKSQELDPGLGTQFNLADCYERVGQLASAHALFAQVAQSARATGQQQRARVAEERAAAVAPRLSKLRIAVPGGQGSGLRIERDGVELPVAEWNVPVAVDPGVHSVRAWGPGLGQWQTEVSVTVEGSVEEVSIPGSDEPSFFDPLHRKLGIGAAAVGLIGISAGTVFGLRAISKKNEANRAGCDGATCRDEQSAELREDARRAGNTATLTMSIGAAGLATAAVLFWVVSEPQEESPAMNPGAARLELHPVVAAGGGGLWLRGAF